MGGTIIIEGLRLFGYHGVGEQERIVGNTFEFDIKLHCGEIPAMQTDSIDGTISYADIIDIVKEENSHPSALLERLAFRIAAAIREKYPTAIAGSVAVYKPAPPVSAEIKRAGFLYEWNNGDTN